MQRHTVTATQLNSTGAGNGDRSAQTAHAPPEHHNHAAGHGIGPNHHLVQITTALLRVAQNSQSDLHYCLLLTNALS